MIVRRGSAVFLLLAAMTFMPHRVRACEDEGRPCCDYCRMIITEKAFGGEVRTADQKLLIFDATECMAAFWLMQRADTVRLRSLRSIRHERPSERIDARRAWYVHCDSLPSPMGMNLSAYGSAAQAMAALGRRRGRLLRWNEVVSLVRGTWFPGYPSVK